MTGPGRDRSPSTVVVTGASGFAGRHLLDSLAAAGATVHAWRPTAGPLGAAATHIVDLLDKATIRRALRAASPDLVFHLAGLTDVAGSWMHAADTLEVNVRGTLNLFEAILEAGIRPRIVISGSATVYAPSPAALDERAPIAPQSPYALSKLAQERLALKFVDRYDLTISLARAFNHTGPGQSPAFAVSSFARQIARIEAGQCAPVIEVGNLDARRDLSDVRDVVRAYVGIGEAGSVGRPYNVCTGVAVRMSDVLSRLLTLARVRAEIRADPARSRPSDAPVVLGSHERLSRELGWQPAIPLEQTLSDLLESWRLATTA